LILRLFFITKINLIPYRENIFIALASNFVYMEIQILQLLDGARKAEGLSVIIDVFRAFSLACYVTNNGASKILPVGDISQAYNIKLQNPDFVLIGERNERIPEGFDYGNSPTHIINVDFTGKTIIHTTSAGTQGLVNATNASERLTGSFVNAPAIVEYIKRKRPAKVSLVCMGYAMKQPSEEDTFCAEYIKACLENIPVDFNQMKEVIRASSAKRLFLPENQSFSPASDFDLCTDLGKFSFVLKAEEKGGALQLIPIKI
jgi:2-phosphosulfolactate phosphatase